MLNKREPLSLSVSPPHGAKGPDPSILVPVTQLFGREWLKTPPFLCAARKIRAST